MIRKLSLISKFVTSQSGLQIITIHILPNTSRKKGNQTMKFDRLIKYNAKNIFFSRNHAENGAWTLVPDLFLIFKKALSKIKTRC